MTILNRLTQMAFGAGLVAIATASPAQAFSTQTVGPYNFTINSTATNLNIPITPLTPQPGQPLGAVKIKFNTLSFGGQVSLGNPSGTPINATLSATALFDFGAIPVAQTTTASYTANLSTSTVPATGFITPTVSGSFTPPPFILPATPSVLAYFSGSPVLGVSLAAFTVTPGLLASYTTPLANPRTNITGSFNIEYQFVPGPLPIAGAAVAFAQSRRLRRRIKARALA